MEALQLPHDLYWGTKTEPPSPQSDDQLFPSIALFSPKLESDDEAEDVIVDAATEDMISAALINGDILLHLEINEDGTAEWDCIQGVNYPTHHLPLSIADIKDNTSELKRYSESTDIIQLSPAIDSLHRAIFATENFNFASCPYNQQQELVQQQQQEAALQKLDYESFFSDLTLQTLTKSNDECVGSPTSSSAYEELSESERGDEIVDEILRIHTKNLPDFTDDNDSQYSTASYASTSDDSSYKVNSVNSMSPTSSHDWPLPKNSDEYSSKKNLQQMDDDGNVVKSIKKRSRLYVRNVDEKKSRKKEQNKNAATRYRQKKKIEMQLDLDEETVLLEKNSRLRKTVEDHQREMKYLKKLIREFYKK